ncbi:MAG TPA: hypothetical protein VK666_08010, partial [Chryseolinea sp.]|nr:hypothetical protein [Chryseolinea sp.]
MKKLILSAMFTVLVCAGTGFAQSTFEKTKKLADGEVPVAVLKSFQKDHADLQDKGFWKLHYSEKLVGGKTVF